MGTENYQIIKNICSLPEKSGGWHKELNLISWFGRMPVYDLREWDGDRKMKKGITLHSEELAAIKECLLKEETI